MEKDSIYTIDFEEIESHISESLKLLKYHEKTYISGVNGGILLDHFMSLKHAFEFLGIFFKVSKNIYLIQRITSSVFYVNQKLYSLTYHRKDESLVMKLVDAYEDLREEINDVIMKPGTNEYDEIFPKIFGHDFSLASIFLCKKIKELLTSDCEADQVTPMAKELEDIRKMLASLLEPFFRYAESVVIVNEEDRKIFASIATVIDRATCFIYLCFVGKMDDEMVLSLKNGLSDLIIEEAQVMEIYLNLDIDSIENIESHIYMSMRLLDWNKKCYVGTEVGAALEDHFMSIKQGLKILVRILKVSRGIDLKLLIQHFVSFLKQRLYIIHNQGDENMSLEHAYGELREEMKNVVIKPGNNDYDMLFTEIFQDWHCLSRTKDFIIKKIMKLVASSCKAKQMTPMMKELEGLRKKLTLLKPLFDHVTHIFAVKEDEEEILFALTTFLDRATCLIYMSFVGKLNEDILVSVRKNLSLLIEETAIKEMSIGLGIIFEDELESDIDISLSLLKMQEEYHIGTINEAMLKDHTFSLKHAIELLKWMPKIYSSGDVKRHIIQLAQYVKKNLESLTCQQGDESLNMDVNAGYGDLREEMKNLIINPTDDRYDTLHVDFRGNNDYIVKKIMTLVTSNCKADQIAPLKKELQDLWKMLMLLKPLGLYIELEVPLLGNVFTTLLTFHHKSTFLIYLSFVGKMDNEMVLSVKSNISRTIKETDVLEMYTMILNEVLIDNCYLEKELYLLENLILLFERNVESLNDTNSKLYEVLIDVHIFLLGLSPGVLSRKIHVLQPSFQAILGHSIPIISSCYHEHTEAEISAELNYVLDLIKRIKSEALEIKLYSFPRVDDFGFLEFFSGYLEDLMKNHELAVKEEIDALHFEVHSLLSLAKVRNQEELKETPWTDIINMAYQAEYIIDLYLASSSGDSGLIPSLSKIIEQLKNIRADGHGFYFTTFQAQEVSETSKSQVFGMTAHVGDNDAIVGLQKEARIITDNLLMGENKLDVISIVGMAGVGKTTLALMVYNTPSVADHFDISAWCTVSQTYKNKDLLLSILDQVKAPDKSHRSISDDQELANHFCRSLKKSRYLIVLDDIWDTTLWNYLKRYLPHGCEGSRILITSRNRDVVDQIGSKVNQLHRLSEENSWELFQIKMLEKESLSDDLLNIAKDIVENCKGLPLSIIIIAGILYGIERTENKWNQIAKSVSSLVLTDPQGKCKAILELSYNHLPNYLRSCFLYLGSFPEDQEISMNHLIMRWIAEGLVLDTKSDSAEEVASKYMEDLIVKSLVIPTKERSRGGVKTFRLHDLLRDFCLDKAKEKNFFTVLDQRNDSRPLRDPRRLIINVSSMKDLHFSCHGVRSMICLDDISTYGNRIGNCDMGLLRVFEVWSGHFKNISSLFHLRYLALNSWFGEIPILPSLLSKLHNLQILILRCTMRIVVPDLIWDMVKLRHVHITPRASFQVDSNRHKNSSFLLENLRSLSKASISWGDFKWLSKLSGVQRLYCVFVDHNLEEDDALVEEEDLEKEDDDLEEEEDAPEEKEEDALEEEEDLEEEDDALEEDDLEEEDLEEEDDDLEEEEEDLDEEDDDLEDNQFPMLSFHGHLTSLKMKNEAGVKQRFMRTCQLPISLRKLKLSKFYLKSNDISEIGRTLPHLEVFKIYKCFVPSGYQWNVDDEDFRKLKVLKLKDLKVSNWNASENSFPNLEQLWVEKCKKLDEIPLDFAYLLKLRLISVRECAPSVDDSAREILKLQHEDQNTEMRVHIYPKK